MSAAPGAVHNLGEASRMHKPEPAVDPDAMPHFIDEVSTLLERYQRFAQAATRNDLGMKLASTQSLTAAKARLEEARTALWCAQRILEDERLERRP